MKNIFQTKEKENCCLKEGSICIHYSGETLELNYEQVQFIEYNWDFSLGVHMAGLTFNLGEKKEIEFNGHILHEEKFLRVLREAFPGLLKDIDLEAYLNSQPMWGFELIWVKGKNVQLAN